MESTILGFAESRIHLKESGIPLTIGIQNPSSTDKYWNPESSTQDCPGFPYMGRVIGSTPFVRATPFKFLSHSFSFILLPLPTPLVRVLYHCNEYNAGNDYSFLWCISLQSSSPGPCGWGAGKGRRACNYVSGIWIPPPIPLWLPVDWAVRFLPISQKQKRARMWTNIEKHY